MLSSVIAGCALGGLVYAYNGIYKIFNNNKAEDIENNIQEDIWENIWHYNNIEVKKDDEILMPVLIKTETLKNIIRYTFQIPIGITTKDIENCKTQIKEIGNAEKVDIMHYKNNLIYIDLYKAEDINIHEGSIENDKWNELWRGLELVTGNRHDGFKYPYLISEEEINGGISYIFQMPIGKSSYHIIKEDVTIKEFLEARQLEIIPLNKNRVELRAIYKPLPELVPFELVPRSSEDSFEIPVGKYIDGYATLDFKKVANVLNAGMQGSGKSISTKCALTYLGCMYEPEELEIYISDLKRTELNRFKDMKHVKKYVEFPKETDLMIKELTRIMDTRYTKFSKVKVSDIYEYNEKFPEDKMPYIFVAIEEISRYTSDMTVKLFHQNRGEEDQNERLSKLLFYARASGINFWCTVQRPTKENLSPDVKSSLGNILAFKTANILNSMIICDDEKLKFLRGSGNGYLITEGAEKEFQAFYLSNDEIEQILIERSLLKDEEI